MLPTRKKRVLKILQRKGGASLQQVEKAEADALALAAQISATKNEIARAKLDLEYSRITADIAGRVSKAEMTEGNLVNAGGSDPLLTTIVSVDPIRINFNVDERSMLRYAKSIGEQGGSLSRIAGQNERPKGSISVCAWMAKLVLLTKASCRFGDNRVDHEHRNNPGYTASCPIRQGMFVPGSRVRVRLTIGKPYTATLVPDTAILADQDKRYVLIVDDKKTVRRRDVTLGAVTDDGMRAIQPANKLAEGESAAQWEVIVDNLQRARLNYPVEATTTPGSAVASR